MRSRARSRTVGSSSQPVMEPPTYEPAVPRPPMPEPVDPTWRDSILTTDSSGSSLYPASSHADSLHTPASISHDHIFVQKAQEDDVSLRLRLLVNNNYFLPPAHAKPSSADFKPPPSPAEPYKPGFMDMFKSKKVPTPEPIIRTTSDLSIPRTRTLSETSQWRTGTVSPNAAPRVAVLREQLPDLSQAARQAASELKSRPRPSPARPYFDINPTDTVDMPMSALGPQEALGAEVLAENLPPRPDDEWRRNLMHAAVKHSFSSSPSPPGSAVSSSYGSLLASPSPIHSPSSVPCSPSPSTGSKIIMGQPISISSPVILSSPPPRRTSLDAKSHYASRGVRSPLTPSSFPQNHYPPTTPLSPPPRKSSYPVVNPLYSLSQADLITPSTSVFPASVTTTSPSYSPTPVRSMRSSSSLNPPGRDAIPLSMTPPPSGPNERLSEESSTSSSTSRSRSHSHSDRAESVITTTTESMYSEGPERRSLALSAMRDGHGTHNSSPSTVVGSDGEDDDDVGNDTTLSYHTAISSPPPMRRDNMISPPPRASSSFSHHRQHLHALSPPPRQSSLGFQPPPESITPPLPARNPARNASAGGLTPVRSDFAHGGWEEPQEQWPPEIDTRAEMPGIIVEPGPTTPPFPSSSPIHRRERGQTLDITALSSFDQLRSAPAVSTSFFDSLPPSMTEFEDSSDDENSQTHLPPLAPPPVMRLGNHSSPSLRGGPYGQSGYNSSQSSLMTSSAASIKSSKSSRSSIFKGRTRFKKQKVAPPPLPVSYIAQSAPFFKATPNAIGASSSHDLMSAFSRSPSQHSLLPPRSPLARPDMVLSPSDVIARASMSSSRASTEEGRGTRNGKTDFDGLLARHLKTERDVLKEIAERNAGRR